MRLGTAITFAFVLVAGVPGAASAAGLQASAKLAKELRAAGRAEVTLRYALPGVSGDAPHEVRGTLALEPPDRVRLDVAGTGERLVARSDGGEWLQPSTKQLLRFGSEQVSPAFRWWRVLLGDAGLVRERRVAQGRYVLVMKSDAGAADSATVWLDSRGLPSRLDVGAGDGGTYRLSGWKFLAPRGAAGFRLSAPQGYETIDLP
jgi:hypothetical protein